MTLTYFWGHRGQFKHENLQFSLVNTITQQNINRIGPKLIPWMYFKSVFVKFEDGWPWPIFEVTGVNLSMKICNNSTNINCIGPKLIPWMYLRSVLVKLENGWTWPTVYVEVIGLISKLNLFHYKHDKHVTQSILVTLIPNLYHGCISSSKMDDLDLSFFVRKCMFMTSPHSARRWIAWGVLVICTLLITSGTWQ